MPIRDRKQWLGRWMQAPDVSRQLQKRMFWVAFVLRVLFMTLGHKYQLRGERQHFEFGWEMGRIARALATGHGYADPFGGYTGPTAWVPPLFPLILGGVFKLFGVYSVKSAWVILTINSAFSASIAPAIYEIGWRCFGRNERGLRLATWSGWLWVLLPAASQYAVHWVWEMSLSAALLAWITVVALRMRGLEGEDRQGEGRQTPQMWSLFGLLWGLLALSNSSLLPFLPFCAVWALWTEHRGHLRRAFLNAIVAGICCAAVISPWVLRNYYVFHAFVPMRTNFGAELFESTRFWNEGFPTMATLTLAEKSPDWQEYKRVGELAYSKEKGRQAVILIKERPRTYVFHAFKRFIFFWDGVPNPIYSTGSLIAEIIRELNYCILSLGGLLGLALALRRKVPGAWLFFWAFLSLPFVYYFVSVQARFRHPLEPFIVLLTVYVFQSAERRRASSFDIAEPGLTAERGAVAKSSR